MAKETDLQEEQEQDEETQTRKVKSDLADDSGDTVENTEGEQESEKDKLKEELDKIKAQANGHYDRWIRLKAEFENYKKRTQKEFATLIKTANEDLIVQLISVLDNIERSLNHVEDDTDPQALKKGIEMILEQFKGVLSKEGLRTIESLGKPFDPDFHEAVMQLEEEGQDSSTVIEEVEKGYMLKDKVIRHAKVVVNK